ncbi:acyltransferase family protein [Castellaniella defragrans]|uniref:Peptidoglycan/LPS O-acetylase OafA/YrhL n=1 Tax=Castellaniella defragrans TaxID=75697 RepID=A0A7W9WP03_CASDE|nr:acyltransferase [Castellaniella defragrans]KAB0603355.1 acyltransferase [Castellaniella defragrans]MBB6084093.1 peptidoglycan/LPS O-acetylase OafA/YrhL [Castellaniella defragrans]
MRSSSSFYLSRLDHLRFVAAALVVLFHYLHAFVGQVQPINPLAIVVSEGHMGIGLFMVLSGFIFAVLCAGKSVDYKLFLFNRFVRIYPLYIFAVVLAVTLMVYQKQINYNVFDIFQWLLLFRPSSISDLPQFSHLWTIPVEFSFYLLFPFFHQFYKKYGARYFIGMIGLLLLLRAGIYLEYGTVRYVAYETLFGRLDQFLIGYLAACCYLAPAARRRFSRPWMLALACGLVFYVIHWLNRHGGGANVEAGWWIVWPTVEALAWAALVLAYLCQRWSLPVWADRLLAQGGVLSFSLYVCHPWVISVLAPRVGVLPLGLGELGDNILTGVLVALPASLFLAWTLNRLIEKPFLEFRRSYLLPQV